MTTLLTIDIGGTTIKYAKFMDGELSANGAVNTPDNLDAFYDALRGIKAQFPNDQFEGVAISAPGAVNKAEGVIEGASALPYIHDFPIFKEFETIFGLPVSVENDANCAALAEVGFGSAKDYQNVLFVVLGTGVGGAVIVDGKVEHGKHLYGGEFGFMLMDEEHTWSDLGTTIRMEERYNNRTGLSLKAPEIFQRAFDGEVAASEEAEIFYYTVAKGIYNLQYSFDPELFVIGGGVSQADFLVPEVKKRLQDIMDVVKIAKIMPEIVTADFKNDANMIGAAVDWQTEHN
jgi:predicted NBD/HSP70 family sugar kinase